MEISYKNVKNQAYQQSVENTLARLRSADSTFSITTSGSTGVPKTIQLQKKHMLASAEATIDYLNIPTGASALLCLPADKIAGAMMLTRAMVGAWRLTVTEPSSEPLEGLEEEKFHFSAMVPLQVKKSLPNLNQLEKLIIGGGAVDHRLVADLQNTQSQCWHTFGMTETISHIAMRKLSPQFEQNFSALKGVHFSTDHHQRLIINAPHIGLKKLLTNDVVKLNSARSFEWLGRFDNVVNSAGVKLFPEAIEKKIKMADRFFLAGLPDPYLGEKLILVVERAQALPPEIIESALHDLGKFEKPREVFYLPQFTYTSNGKLQRTATLERLKPN